MSDTLTSPPHAAEDATQVESIEQPETRSYDLTAADIQALSDLMPKLAGEWTTHVGTDEGQSVQVYIARRGSWSPYRQHFIVVRQGATLRLMASRIPYGPQFLGTFERITDLTDTLGDAIGWRRSRAGASSF